MKTSFKAFLIFSFALFFLSCETNEIQIDEIPTEIKLKSGTDYKYDFHISGDEEGATIVFQAKHYAISEIIRNENTNWSIVYHYKSEVGFIGKDSVTIETCTGGDGTNCGETNQIKLNFIITE